MASNKPFANIIVSEHFQIANEKNFRTFMESNEATYVFPPTLTNVERAWVHNYAKALGLNSKSHGKEPIRQLTICKPNKFRLNKDTITLSLVSDNMKTLGDFLNRFPHSKESLETQPIKTRHNDVENNIGQLTFGFPQLPASSLNKDLIQFRTSLPIWPLRDHLMETIISNQVSIIHGETGCGKTTQLPQFILDYSRSNNEPCRIICTQPRRISAVSVAERVSAERNEKIGQSVGYHIRLESCVGPKTVLIYCTNGILLRTLMNGDSNLRSYTHIIIDEIHERDRFSDFLLICLRECLVNHPHLRLILMSATVNVGIFQKYFNNPPVIHIQGRLFPVKEYYLEDVLSLIKYNSPGMIMQKKKTKIREHPILKNNSSFHSDNGLFIPETYDVNYEMDECIVECFERGTDDSFAQILQLILSEHVPINYQHSETKITSLMAAANHGSLEIVQQLISFGADVRLRNVGNYNAYDFAFTKQHVDIAQLLQMYEKLTMNKNSDTNPQVDEEKQEQLQLYQQSISDNVIDYDLILSLILFIHLNNPLGSILVFLPGYDDIVMIKDKILSEGTANTVPYQIFTLHSTMQMSDQHKVFGVLPNKRKIILSTNISETSITIDDVVYVIDSGKVKEKCYDAIIGVCALESTWISQACAKQRAGRAGRTQPGICFHLFSQYRHHTLQNYTTPEILRMPLHELCLQTKMLAPEDTKICDFLSRALEPPSSMAVQTAIEHLQDIDALDFNENLTPLGNHLVDIPVEPRLAKMLIYSVIFKCLDPILTLVSCMAYRDPFVLPSATFQKSHALNIRKNFGLNTFSDHMILIRAFQAWQDARITKKERNFCNKNYISGAIMEMIVGTRTQLLAQLRACSFVKTKPPGDIRELNANANNWAMIKAVLTSGLYPNMACINKNTLQIKTKKEKKVSIHQSSSLRIKERSLTNNAENVQSLKKIPADWLIFDEMSRNGSNYNLRGLTCISPLTVALFADIRKTKQISLDNCNELLLSASFTMNDWITFEGPVKLLNMIISLREKITYMINKKIANPFKTASIHDENLNQVLASILQKEDDTLGLFAPQGIGQRPKMLSVHMHPAVNNMSINQHRQLHLNFSKNSSEKVPEVLRFKPILKNNYKKYDPSDSELEKPSTSAQNNFDQFYLPYVQPEFQVNQVDFLCDQTNYSLNFQKNPPYQQFNSLYEFNNVIPQSNALQNDFELNGINVMDEDEQDGACSLPVPNPLVTWLINVCNPDYTSYYIIKAGSMKSLDISISKKTWIFSPQTEHKLLQLIEIGKVVMLIFTVNNSGAFQGIARLLDGPGKNTSTHMLACPIEWLSRADIPYNEVAYLNVPTSIDGQEIPANIGMQLCMKFTDYYPKPPQQMEPCVIPMGRAIRGSFRN